MVRAHIPRARCLCVDLLPCRPHECRSFDTSSGTIRGHQGWCLSIDTSESASREGSAILACPFVGGAWQRFVLVPSGAVPVVDASSSSHARDEASHPAAVPSTAPAIPAASHAVGGAAACAVAPKPLPLETAAPALSPNVYQLPLPPDSSPALQRLRFLLERVRGECDSISPAQRVSMTCEVSALRSQVPLEYHPQLLELLRLLASNSRIQAKSPRPPYFMCNAAAPTPQYVQRDCFQHRMCSHAAICIESHAL
jgi:hypothetical protein